MPVMSAVILVVVGAAYAYFFWPVDMMKAPGDAGTLISREAFQSVPNLYFFLLRTFGGGVAGSVFSGFPGSLICVAFFLWRCVDFMYGGLLSRFLFPIVRCLFSFGGAIASFLYGSGGLLCGFVATVVRSLLSVGGGAVQFVYGGLVRGFLIPVVCSLWNLGRDVAGIMYVGLVRGCFIPVVSSLLSFVLDVAGLVYDGLVRGFLFPIVSSLLKFGGGVASFMYGLLTREFLIPFVLGLLVARLMGLCCSDDRY